MKKALSIFLVVVVVAVGYFTFFDNEDLKSENPILAKIEENPNMYPLCSRLDKDEKEAYIKIVTAFQNFDESISNVYKSDSKRGVENFIYSLECNVYREIAYEHPEMFWYDPYNFESTISNNGKNEYFLHMQFLYQHVFLENQMKSVLFHLLDFLYRIHS